MNNNSNNNKILTISIAAYNVADYIREGLDSLVASQYIDNLEIFVVDDGGQDETLAIAKTYQEKYPNSIFPIHKENGGYGTTVNYSMKHATGKYFKLLDGDDWFDTQALDQLVENLMTIETDVIITPYMRGSQKDEMTMVHFNEVFAKGEQLLKTLTIERAIAMWSICYRTSVLRESKLVLPERLLYTDQYFALMPFTYAKTIQYFNFPVYQYRLGRDGQSVSRESRIKNIEMFVTICKDLAKFVKTHQTHENFNYLFYRVFVTYRNAVRTFLLLSVNRETAQRLMQFDNDMQVIFPELYQAFVTHRTNRKLGYFIALCRLTKYRLFNLIKLLYPKGYPNF